MGRWVKPHCPALAAAKSMLGLCRSRRCRVLTGVANMTFLSLSSGRCRCALARTRPAARRAAALRSSLGHFNGDHPARWWIGRRSAMLVTSPCRSSANSAQLRPCLHRAIVTGLTRPFRLEVVASSESLCGKRCSQGPSLRRKKELGKASGSGCARHRNEAVASLPDVVSAPSAEGATGPRRSTTSRRRPV